MKYYRNYYFFLQFDLNSFFFFVENEVHRQQQAILEQHLASEIGLITLDCMGLYSMHFRKKLLNTDPENEVLKKMFDIYLSFIQIGQSETLLRHVFASLRAFINNYSVMLFQGKIFVELFVSKLNAFLQNIDCIWLIMLI